MHFQVYRIRYIGKHVVGLAAHFCLSLLFVQSVKVRACNEFHWDVFIAALLITFLVASTQINCTISEVRHFPNGIEIWSVHFMCLPKWQLGWQKLVKDHMSLFLYHEAKCSTNIAHPKCNGIRIQFQRNYGLICHLHAIMFAPISDCTSVRQLFGAFPIPTNSKNVESVQNPNGLTIALIWYGMNVRFNTNVPSNWCQLHWTHFVSTNKISMECWSVCAIPVIVSSSSFYLCYFDIGIIIIVVRWKI